jgi:hypothetical protein
MDKKLIKSIVFEGIDYTDYPDYCDAYIVSAEYDGKPMTDEQIDELNDDTDFLYELLIEHLH